MAAPLSEKLAMEAMRLIEWHGARGRPQEPLTKEEYAELLDSFSALDLHLSDAFRKSFISTLKRRFTHVAVVNDQARRDKYFPEAIRGMADYFLVADMSTRRGFSVIVAHASKPINIKLVTVP